MGRVSVNCLRELQVAYNRNISRHHVVSRVIPLNRQIIYQSVVTALRSRCLKWKLNIAYIQVIRT